MLTELDFDAGKADYAYFRTYRLQIAERLLREGELSVAEIAAKIGYTNPNKFTSAFFVRSIDLARHLAVSKSSVSRAVAILQQGGFLTVDDDYFLHLTGIGQEIAEKIYERHQFFTDSLIEIGVDPVQAEKDACKIEHVISDESFQKLKEAYKEGDDGTEN